MRHKTFLVSVFFLSAVLVLLSLVLFPAMRIEDFRTEGIPMTYSVSRYLQSLRGESLLVKSRGRIQKDLLALGYLDSLAFSFSSNILSVKGTSPSSGIVVTSGDSSWFFDGDYRVIDSKDVPVLSQTHSLVWISGDYAAYSRKYGFEEEFTQTLGALSYAQTSIALITKAEYDNNKSSIFGGTLRVKLDEAEAVLDVSDFRDKALISDSIGVIRREYENSKVRLTGEVEEYVLHNAQLSRIKR